jgi:hypothetical protein
VCHGVAGLLEIALSINSTSPNERTLSHSNALAQKLTSAFDRNLTFGYQMTVLGLPVGLDEPGLLNGAAGIGMVLMQYGLDNAQSASLQSPLLIG